MLERIGKVGYRSELLASSHVHLVFHVSLQKKKIGNNTLVMVLPSKFNESTLKGQRQPETIMTIQRCGYRHELLVKWYEVDET